MSMTTPKKSTTKKPPLKKNFAQTLRAVAKAQAEYEAVTLRLPLVLAAFVRSNPVQTAEILQNYLNNKAAGVVMSAIQNMAADEKQKPMLHRAEDTINGPRQNDYGDKLVNFAQIANLWTGTIGHKLQVGRPITPEDVALCMIQVKVARLAKSPDHQDSILDIAGYAGCYDKLQDERKAGATIPGALRDSRAFNALVSSSAPAGQK